MSSLSVSTSATTGTAFVSFAADRAGSGSIYNDTGVSLDVRLNPSDTTFISLASAKTLQFPIVWSTAEIAVRRTDNVATGVTVELIYSLSSSPPASTSSSSSAPAAADITDASASGITALTGTPAEARAALGAEAAGTAAASTAALDAQLRTEGLLNPDLFPPYRGGSFELVQLGASPTENADAVRAAYARAKASQPGGSPRSVTNRFTIIHPPGVYDFGAAGLVMDAAYIDLVPLVPSAGYVYVADTAAGAGRAVIYLRPGELGSGNEVRITGLATNTYGQYSLATEDANATIRQESGWLVLSELPTAEAQVIVSCPVGGTIQCELYENIGQAWFSARVLTLYAENARVTLVGTLTDSQVSLMRSFALLGHYEQPFLGGFDLAYSTLESPVALPVGTTNRFSTITITE